MGKEKKTNTLELANRRMKRKTNVVVEHVFGTLDLKVSAVILGPFCASAIFRQRISNATPTVIIFISQTFKRYLTTVYTNTYKLLKLKIFKVTSVASGRYSKFFLELIMLKLK